MTILVWTGFIVFVLAMVALDLGIFHRRARVVHVPEALMWTALWILLALAFGVVVYFLYERGWHQWTTHPSHAASGREAVLQYFTGYVVEKSLSIDNIFVIAMILAYFRIPAALQHRLLIWGVTGAMILRGVMIASGALLIERFAWIVYVFGLLLIGSAVKMLLTRHDNLEPDRNFALRIVRRIWPVTSEFDGDRFFSLRGGRRAATPMFLALILVESSDVIFAIDSIPAIFAITRDPFLVFTSNIFAILGLRSLYFALAGLMERFRYLKMSLVFLLAYIGVKMLLSHHHPIPNVVSLSIIGGILSVGILASLTGGSRDTAPLAPPILDDLQGLARITYRQARRITILVVGSTILVIGMAMIILPGPAILVVPLGLSILAIEFAWARRWLSRIQKTVGAIRNSVADHLRRTR